MNVRELTGESDLLVSEYSHEPSLIPDLPGTYDWHAPPIGLEPISDFEEEW